MTLKVLRMDVQYIALLEQIITQCDDYTCLPWGQE